MTWKVAALYRFTPLENLPELKAAILASCLENSICGTVLLAPEGINGTIAGPPDGLDAIMQFLDGKCGVLQGEIKYSAAAEKPFMRMKVRLKKEIVTLRAPEANPAKCAGTYVGPRQWNELLGDPDTVVIDTRNVYETKIGMFKGAIDPGTDNFTEFKNFVKNTPALRQKKKIAMYCTGGIRCEKASAYMKAHGFDEVYHLKGGILKYLETIPADESLWQGSCFVFDKRVAIDHGLAESDHEMCYGCREPLETEELRHPSYEPGVSCPHCVDKLTPERAQALRMRHRQMETERTTCG